MDGLTSGPMSSHSRKLRLAGKLTRNAPLLKYGRWRASGTRGGLGTAAGQSARKRFVGLLAQTYEGIGASAIRKGAQLSTPDARK